MLPSGLEIWHGGRWGHASRRKFLIFPWKGSVGLLLPNWSVLGLEARASKLFHCFCLRGFSILPSALQVSHGGSWDNFQGGKCLIFLKKSSSGSLFSNYAILEPKPGNPSILYGNLGLRFADYRAPGVIDSHTDISAGFSKLRATTLPSNFFQKPSVGRAVQLAQSVFSMILDAITGIS